MNSILDFDFSEAGASTAKTLSLRSGWTSFPSYKNSSFCHLLFQGFVLDLVARPLGHLDADALEAALAHVEAQLGLLVPRPEAVRQQARRLVLDRGARPERAQLRDVDVVEEDLEQEPF